MANLWTRCNHCRRILYKQDIIENLFVCPSCNFHFRLSAEKRLQLLYDNGEYHLYDENISPLDPLGFVDSKKYSDRLKTYAEKTHPSIPLSIGPPLLVAYLP